jgi:hypothetical protein
MVRITAPQITAIQKLRGSGLGAEVNEVAMDIRSSRFEKALRLGSGIQLDPVECTEPAGGGKEKAPTRRANSRKVNTCRAPAAMSYIRGKTESRFPN